MSQESFKASVVFGVHDLSAFAVASMVQGLGVKQVGISQKAERAKEPAVLNVELAITKAATSSQIYGEISILDFLASFKNSQEQNREVLRFGDNLSVDNLVHRINSSLRNAANAGLKDPKKAADLASRATAVVAQYQALAKSHPAVARFGIVQAMLYSYLSPVASALSPEIQDLLASIKEQNGLITFEEFQKLKKIAEITEKKVSKAVSFEDASIKLTRLNKGRKLLPEAGRRNILVTSALPYVNNVPHLGNIIGCVLSADVFARFARLRGYNTVYICGTDEYGTATETKAIEEGLTPREICDKYHAIHNRIYEWFDIDTELFGRTSTPKHTGITQEIFNALREQGNTYEEVVEQQYCLSCDRFLADRFVHGECPMCHYYDARGDQCDGCGKLIDATELIKPKCKLCGKQPEVRSSKHIFIDLARITPDLQKWVAKQQVEGEWSYNATFFTNNLLSEGLHGRCITRDLKWGTPIPLDEYQSKVFYVWFDAPIGYISITANYLGAETEDWRKWWQNPEQVELYQFMGKDNTTFHTVIFPSTLIGSKLPFTLLKNISTTEFLNYEIDEHTGKPKKFSKSRGTGIFGDDAEKTGIPVEVWRYYLLANRPEQQDTVFLWSDFLAKNNSELLNNLGNFSNRCLQFLSSTMGGVIPEYAGAKVEADAAFFKSLFEKFQEFAGLLEEVKLKSGLRVAMSVSSLCNEYLQEMQPWELAKKDRTRCDQVVNVAAQALLLLSSMLEPYMPSFSAKIYKQMNIARTEEQETLYEHIFNNPAKIENLVQPGHKIGEPKPIFRRISEEEAEQWKAQFGGDKK